MPKASVNGTNLYYERHGKGVPFILICGFNNTIEMWENITSQLKNYFEIIMFDHRGSGRSETTAPPYTMNLLAHDVIKLMDALGIQKAHVMGAAMGAAVIQTLGLRYPQRLLKGILLAPFHSTPSAMIRIEKTMRRLLELGIKPELAIETIIPWLFSNTFLSNPKQIERMISSRVNHPFPQTPEGYAGQLSALEAFNLTDKLSKIETEMLIISGQEDLLIPLPHAKALADRLLNKAFVSASKVGHMLHIEAVKTVLEETLAFCKA